MLWKPQVEWSPWKTLPKFAKTSSCGASRCHRLRRSSREKRPGRTWLGSQKNIAPVFGEMIFDPADSHWYDYISHLILRYPILTHQVGLEKLGPSSRRLSFPATNHFFVALNIEVKWGHTYLSWIIKCLANSFTNKNAPTFHCWLHLYFHSINHTV